MNTKSEQQSGAKPAPLDLSIIIVNWNTGRLLADCLRSIRQMAGINYEVIVVDNASEDGSVPMIRFDFPEVTLMVNSINRGFAGANNQAIEFAKGRYVMLLNPDTVVLDNALARMVAFLDTHPDVGIVGPKMLKPDHGPWRYETWFPTITSYIFNPIMLRVWGDAKAKEVDWVCGAALMIRKEVIEQIGPLDDSTFMFVEDVDWCMRAKQAGWKVFHDAEAQIIHIWGEAAKKDPESRIIRGHLAKLYLFQKHKQECVSMMLRGVMILECLSKMLLDAVALALRAEGNEGFRKRRQRAYQHLLKILIGGNQS